MINFRLISQFPHVGEERLLRMSYPYYADSYGACARSSIPDSLVPLINEAEQYNWHSYPQRTNDGCVVAYVDGCCLGNGSPHARAGVGVWFGENHPL
jgi:hypothetical protein